MRWAFTFSATTRVENQNHAKFIEHLDQSQDGVWHVARWLSAIGYSVQITPTTKAESHDDWKNHADAGDIQLLQRVEVKTLSIHFTGKDDWPFKEKFIVCARHAFDRSTVKPFAFVILNSAKTHAAIVKGETHPSWTVETRTDSRYENVSQEFYLCPIDKVKFIRINA